MKFKKFIAHGCWKVWISVKSLYDGMKCCVWTSEVKTLQGWMTVINKLMSHTAVHQTSLYYVNVSLVLHLLYHVILMHLFAFLCFLQQCFVFTVSCNIELQGDQVMIHPPPPTPTPPPSSWKCVQHMSAHSGHQFANNIFKCIFLNGKDDILIPNFTGVCF